ncbi:DUF4351 domain-containing protein [Isoalcanivorax beigongshangi]|uniref:DUF4351 domain-containing protein n=1 Tax=Isoalcanivorax beigongshangi TaxID=3238810 RepID=A0ABV4AIK8_9GAMM
MNNNKWPRHSREHSHSMRHYPEPASQPRRSRSARRHSADSEQRLLLRLLTARFGTLPAPLEARVRGAEPSQLELWTHRMLQVERLEQVFVDA